MIMATVTGSVPLSLAETPDDPLGSSGMLADRVDSPTAPSFMEVCQDNGDAALLDSQRTSESEQSVFASTKQHDDILKLQLGKG